MKRLTLLGILGAGAGLAIFPVIFTNPAITTVAVFALLFAAAATAWNIFSGYTGYISIGHAAFYGLGAYLFALFCQAWNLPGGWLPFLLLPLVGLLTGLCALPVGWIALKTRNFHFLIFTIAIFALCSQLPNLLANTPLGGAAVSLPVPLWSGGIYNDPFYYVACILLVLSLVLSWWIRRSKYGLALLAIRDDEDRALGMGVKVNVHKLAAFVISTVFVSMVGAMNAYFLGFVAPPSAFDASINILIPLLAFFGGAGTIAGPAIGALVLIPLQQYLTVQFGEQGWNLILYGGMFLLVILLLPAGVFPSLRKNWPVWMKTLHAWKPGRLAIPAPIAIEDPVFSVVGGVVTSDSAGTSMNESGHVVGAHMALQAAPAARSLQNTPFVPMNFTAPTRRLRAIRLVETSSPDTPLPSTLLPNALSATERVILPKRVVLPAARPRPQYILPETPLPPIVEQAVTIDTSLSLPDMAKQSAAPLHPEAARGTCPRCNGPLRAVEKMVFCRRCRLIVSKKA